MTSVAKRHKAENGVGSVKPWKNMWRGRVTLQLLSGETKRITVYGKSRLEAREKLNTAIQESHRGTLTDSKGLLSEYLTSWLSRAEPELKPTTVAKYQDAITKITEQLPKVRFDRLKPGQVEDALSKIQAATIERTKGRTDGKATVTKCRTFLHKVYADALRLQQVGSNPIDHTASVKVKRKKPIMWTLAHMDRFLTAAESHRLYPMLYLAFETGMRRGELLGLRWEDIDFNRHLIHVRRNLVKAGKGLHLQDPKSEAGTRDIPIDDPDVMTMLSRHQKRQETERLKVGDAWARPDMVFTSEVGTLVNPDNVTRLVKSICQAAEVPYKSIHKMRHYHLSNCHALGMPAAELSIRAGHSRISTTTDIYIHDTGHRTPYSTKALREQQRLAN